MAMEAVPARINAAALLLSRGAAADVALACGGRSISFAALRAAVAQAAATWQDCGVEPGELLLLRIPSGIEQAVAFLGAIWAGAVPVPLVHAGTAHLGHPGDPHAPGRFILDTSREGYAGCWRDSVLTLDEWRAYLVASATIDAVELAPAAPACWTAPCRGDGGRAHLLTHALAAAQPLPEIALPGRVVPEPALP
jgi:non-ribosomal peptide synthetase component F